MRWKGLKRTAAYGDRWHSMLMTLMPPVCDLVTVIITGPPNGPVLFCSWASVVVVCTAAGGRAGRPPGARTVGAPATWIVGGRAADTARRASTVTNEERMRPG